MIDLNKIYCGDSANILKEIDNETVDLVVTSPPYSDLRHYGNTLVGWNQEKFMEIAVELYRVLKSGGVVLRYIIVSLRLKPISINESA